MAAKPDYSEPGKSEQSARSEKSSLLPDRGFTCSLIGSFRKHYGRVREAAKVFADGQIEVLSPKMSVIIDPDEWFVRLETDTPGYGPIEIQLVTLDRIFRSSFVYVVDPDGYLGQTTCYEIGRVVERGIPLFFSNAPEHLPLPVPNGSISSPMELVELIKTAGRIPVFGNDEFSLEIRNLSEALHNARPAVLGSHARR